MKFSDLENEVAKVIERIERGTLSALSVEWTRSIQQNFRSGGRPAWAPRSPRYARSKRARGTKLMKISGALMNVIPVTDYGRNMITLNIDPRARAYAKIHNEGGIINMPPRAIKFRALKGKTVFAGRMHKKITKTTVSKGYIIRMPKREFTNIPPDDFPRITNTIKQYLQL